MRLESLRELVTELFGPDAEAAVISAEGLPLMTVCPPLGEDHTGACVAALLLLGQKVADGLACGDLREITVTGSTGRVLITAAGRSAALAVKCPEGEGADLSVAADLVARRVGVILDGTAA